MLHDAYFLMLYLGLIIILIKTQTASLQLFASTVR